jgi:hypothetical protein
MSLHDEYARLTPYELAFQSPSVADGLVEAVREESEGRGADPEDPLAFLTMGSVDAFVRGLEGAGSVEGSLQRFGVLAFHGLHFARAECPLYLLSGHAARYLVEGAPDGSPDPVAPAGYLQFPQHLFWAEQGAGAPESVDGVFWTSTSNGVLHVMLVTGMRSDRAGVGVVPLPEAPLADAELWLEVDARGDGSDYSTGMPGSELDGLYEISTSGEILKLLARFFAYADSVPEALTPNPAASASGAPEPSSLPFTRVSLPG